MFKNVGNSGAARSNTPATAGMASETQEGTMAANTSNRTRLPRTSTALPILGLLGLMSLLGGAVLRFRA